MLLLLLDLLPLLRLLLPLLRLLLPLLRLVDLPELEDLLPDRTAPDDRLVDRLPERTAPVDLLPLDLVLVVRRVAVPPEERDEVVDREGTGLRTTRDALLDDVPVVRRVAVTALPEVEGFCLVTRVGALGVPVVP